MKKIILSALLILIVILNTVSCALIKGPIEDSEFISIITPLLQADTELNGYIWGDSFELSEEPTEEVRETRAPIYYTVKDSPYNSIEELRSAAAEIYTEELMKIINQFAFENSERIMARFCNDYDDDENVTGLRVDVTNNHKPYELTAVAFINTAVVKRSTNNMIEGEIEITAGSSGRRSTMELRLLKQNDTWKLDTQTWLRDVSFE